MERKMGIGRRKEKMEHMNGKAITKTENKQVIGNSIPKMGSPMTKESL